MNSIQNINKTNPAQPTPNRIGVSFLKLRMVAIILVSAASSIAGGIPVRYFSQLDSRWNTELLGTSKLTLGKAGCAVTSGAMALSARGAAVDPKTLNAWLKRNGGFVGDWSLVWRKVADYDGSAGLKWEGVGALPSTPAALKAWIDSGKIIIAYSKRVAPAADHWVAVGGYTGLGSSWSQFWYLDPADRSGSCRLVGDGWVQPGNQVRLFR